MRHRKRRAWRRARCPPRSPRWTRARARRRRRAPKVRNRPIRARTTSAPIPTEKKGRGPRRASPTCGAWPSRAPPPLLACPALCSGRRSPARTGLSRTRTTPPPKEGRFFCRRHPPPPRAAHAGAPQPRPGWRAWRRFPAAGPRPPPPPRAARESASRRAPPTSVTTEKEKTSPPDWRRSAPPRSAAGTRRGQSRTRAKTRGPPACPACASPRVAGPRPSREATTRRSKELRSRAFGPTWGTFSARKRKKTACRRRRA